MQNADSWRLESTVFIKQFMINIQSKQSHNTHHIPEMEHGIPRELSNICYKQAENMWSFHLIADLLQSDITALTCSKASDRRGSIITNAELQICDIFMASDLIFGLLINRYLTAALKNNSSLPALCHYFKGKQ